jgi:hypothetical protein
MSRHQISFVHGHVKHLKTLILLALLTLAACAPVVLTAKDRAGINAGDKVLVLVRVLCTVDEKPFVPCIYRRNDPMLSDKLIVGFAMGSFDTLGEPGNVKIKALSDESFDEGWAFFLVSPGIYYLYIRGPDSSEFSHRSASDYYNRYYSNAPRWRIDVTECAKVIYAGTLTLAGKQNGTLIFGDKIIVPVENQQVPLSDERETADSLLKRHLPGTEVHNSIMRPWNPGDPFIFRSPLSDSIK